MTASVYTHAMWQVKAGSEEAFIRAWERLAEALSALQRKPLWGTLIRSSQDRTLFYSFGPWQSEADVAAMRADEAAQRAFRELIDLCERATPGAFELVKHVVP
jgi:heme-degrading monooxygenase HmoA